MNYIARFSTDPINVFVWSYFLTTVFTKMKQINFGLPLMRKLNSPAMIRHIYCLVLYRCICTCSYTYAEKYVAYLINRHMNNAVWFMGDPCERFRHIVREDTQVVSIVSAISTSCKMCCQWLFDIFLRDKVKRSNAQHFQHIYRARHFVSKNRYCVRYCFFLLYCVYIYTNGAKQMYGTSSLENWLGRFGKVFCVVWNFHMSIITKKYVEKTLWKPEDKKSRFLMVASIS